MDERTTAKAAQRKRRMGRLLCLAELSLSPRPAGKRGSAASAVRSGYSSYPCRDCIGFKKSGPGRHLVEAPGYRLDLLVVWGHSEPDQSVGRGQPLEEIHLHRDLGLAEELFGEEEAGGSGTEPYFRPFMISAPGAASAKPLKLPASMISLVTVFLWAGAFSFANKSFNLILRLETGDGTVFS
jgi:hypothetical protein